MNSISLRRFADVTAAVCLLCAVLFTGASVILYSLVDRVDRQIATYEREADSNVVAMTEVVANAGFGGMIHAFKNYLLRGGDYIRVFDQNTGAILSNIAKLERQLGPDYGAEIQAIRSVILEYQAQAEVVRTIRAMDSSAEGIDAVVAVDDSQATAAMLTLRNAVIETGEPTKSTTLFDLRRALGYSGMVHHFKNYVLRKTPDYEVDARGAAARAMNAIERYRAFGVTATEAAALDIVAEAVSAFITNLDTVGAMIDGGARAEEIDAAVVVPHLPALRALDTLAKENQRAAQASLAELHGNMGLLRLGAICTSLVVLVGVLLFGTLLRWTIDRVAVRPAAEIANGLTALARGETHVDLSPFANDTEIGRIARASRQFREALVDNIRKGEDLRGLTSERDEMLHERTRMISEREDYKEKKAAMVEWRATEEADLMALHDALEDATEAVRMGEFGHRLGTDYSDAMLGLIAADVNRILERMDQTLAELGAAFGPDGAAGPNMAAVTLMRQSMAHTLEALDAAVDDIQRSAEELRLSGGMARGA